MELMELRPEEAKNRTQIGNPVLASVSPNGVLDYSERLRRTIFSLAPKNALAFRVLDFEATPVSVELKVQESIIDSANRPEQPILTEVQSWYSHPVAYFS